MMNPKNIPIEKLADLHEAVKRGDLAQRFLVSEFWTRYLKPHRDSRHAEFDRAYWHPEARRNPQECAQTHLFQSGRAAELYEQQKDMEMWVERGKSAERTLENIRRRQAEISGFHG